MRTRLAAVGLAVAVAGGGLTMAAVGPLGIAGAQEAPAPAPVDAAQTAHDGPLARALDALVADGTLTEAQAAKVSSSVRSEAKAHRTDRQAKRKDRRSEVVAAVAATLGSTPDDVQAGLRAGTSMAEQAEAKGVDRKVLDDAVTKVLTDRIAAAAGAGSLTSEQAAKAEAKVGGAVDKVLDADGSRLAGTTGAGTLRDRVKARRGN